MNMAEAKLALAIVILAVGLAWSTIEAVLWVRATRKENRRG